MIGGVINIIMKLGVDGFGGLGSLEGGYFGMFCGYVLVYGGNE